MKKYALVWERTTKDGKPCDCPDLAKDCSNGMSGLVKDGAVEVTGTSAQHDDLVAKGYSQV